MPEKNAYVILEKIKNGTSTAEERAIVESWYLQWKQENATNMSEEEFLASLEGVKSELPGNKVRIRKLYRISAAASIIFALGISVLFFKPGKRKNVSQTMLVNDFHPGGNKATLTLSNGKQLVLDDQIDSQQLSGTEKNIIKKGRVKGELVYDASSGITAAASSVNKKSAHLSNLIVTPRAGQYKVILSDGTQVWLNAQSSIRFPVVFSETSRQVEVTGEAYFEVAKRTRISTDRGKRQQQRIPFIVKTPEQQVEVLGTHFNINCYENEASTNTTLLEGAVRVSLLRAALNGKPVTCNLHPGQQSRLTGQALQVTTVNAEEEVAWKNGTISFANADIKSIMRQVSRWYNVDVKYRGKIPERTFTGSISRDAKLSELLKILKFSNINFSISGTELTVLP
jgi:transmembrane sensor